MYLWVPNRAHDVPGREYSEIAYCPFFWTGSMNDDIQIGCSHFKAKWGATSMSLDAVVPVTNKRNTLMSLRVQTPSGESNDICYQYILLQCIFAA